MITGRETLQKQMRSKSGFLLNNSTINRGNIGDHSLCGEAYVFQATRLVGRVENEASTDNDA